MLATTLKLTTQLVTPTLRRGALGSSATTANGQIRRFNLHEYQSKDLMDKCTWIFGLGTPP
jgi:hypothetical protein